ncbi:MAG: phage virion morphogenesis protein [Methylococcaceae bacterium]
MEIDDRGVLAALARVQQRIGNITPLLAEIGEDMKESTMERFVTSKDPYGMMWALNSGVSQEMFEEGVKPLIGDTGLLNSTINYNVLSTTAVEIGSPMIYAAMQQFGGTTTQFPHLWGDIPARPYLGLSEADKANILDLTVDYLL